MEPINRFAALINSELNTEVAAVILVFAEQLLVVVAVVAPAAGAVLVPLLVVGGVPVRVPPPVVAVPAVVVVRVRPPRVVRVTLGSGASNDSLQRFNNHGEGPY